MGGYPYVQSAEKFSEFLRKLPSIGKPPSFSGKTLKSLGFTSSNDERFLSAIKFIGLVEDKKGGAPTEEWNAMRSDFEGTIGNLTRSAYSDLFGMYPDANEMDQEALRNYFTANTELGAAAVSKVVSTFMVFAKIGNFAASANQKPRAGKTGKPIDESANSQSTSVKSKTIYKDGNALTINLNVQLQLPSDSTGDVYDKFFSAMKKHLMPDD